MYNAGFKHQTCALSPAPTREVSGAGKCGVVFATTSACLSLSLCLCLSRAVTLALFAAVLLVKSVLLNEYHDSMNTAHATVLSEVCWDVQTLAESSFLAPLTRSKTAKYPGPSAPEVSQGPLDKHRQLHPRAAEVRISPVAPTCPWERTFCSAFSHLAWGVVSTCSRGRREGPGPVAWGSACTGTWRAEREGVLSALRPLTDGGSSGRRKKGLTCTVVLAVLSCAGLL